MPDDEVKVHDGEEVADDAEAASSEGADADDASTEGDVEGRSEASTDEGEAGADEEAV